MSHDNVINVSFRKGLSECVPSGGSWFWHRLDTVALGALYYKVVRGDRSTFQAMQSIIANTDIKGRAALVPEDMHEALEEVDYEQLYSHLFAWKEDLDADTE